MRLVIAPSPAPTGFWPRLWAAPAAVSRSGRRLTRAGLFAFEALRHIRRSAPADHEVDEARARAQTLSWFSENMCVLHGIQVHVAGRPLQRPAIYVANHLGYFDPPAILSVVPALPIAKAELGSWPIVGEGLRVLGALLVERGNAHSGARVLRRCLRLLEAGASVLAFPEGTTTEGDVVLPLRRGIFGAARLAGVPVVPIAVRYDAREACWVGDQSFVPHYVRTSARTSTRVQLVIGDPLPPREGFPDEDLANRVRATLLTMLGKTETERV